MFGPIIDLTVATTGGIIALDITLGTGLPVVSTPIALYRTNQLTSSTTLIYSGLATPVYIDYGDSLPNYLDFATPYSYTVIDPSGSFTTSGITPASYLQVFSGYLDKLIFRMLSAGLNALAIPQGYKKINVLQSMPLSMGSDGTIFPFVVANLDLEQQEFLQIGQAITDEETVNLNVKSLIIFRRYSINVCSFNAQERDFYKNAILAIFYGGILPILNKIGQDVTINVQAAQSQVPTDNLQPGFYVSTTMLDMEGIFNMSIINNFPIIEGITPIVTANAYQASGISITFNI